MCTYGALRVGILRCLAVCGQRAMFPSFEIDLKAPDFFHLFMVVQGLDLRVSALCTPERAA